MKNADIGVVLKDGASHRSKSFLFKLIPISKAAARTPTTLPVPRLKQKNKPAFIASKKNFKTAVLRNKVRRKMRAATIPFLKKAAKDHYLVFSLNKEIATAKPEELKSEVEYVLIKSGMLKN